MDNKNITILLVDDEPDILEIVGAAVKAAVEPFMPGGKTEYRQVDFPSRLEGKGVGMRTTPQKKQQTDYIKEFLRGDLDISPHM